jgi:hypothetical protein
MIPLATHSQIQVEVLALADFGWHRRIEQRSMVPEYPTQLGFDPCAGVVDDFGLDAYLALNLAARVSLQQICYYCVL